MVRAGLHCSLSMSRQILPLLLMLGWNPLVLNATRKYSELDELHVSSEVGDLLAEVVVAITGRESGSEECEPGGNGYVSFLEGEAEGFAVDKDENFVVVVVD
ncbi:hypothetical protein VNO80_15911 [Phaseolus coccineus]|uniref:Secreted protein n=1 Tax=Phaseolus coccineus TaxID=3886 RepID=A0AAN9MMI1_PHACN